MRRTLGTLAVGLLLAGCATAPAPSYIKEVTTLGQVDMTGLVCRTDQVTGSMQKKTYCASPEAWAKYDARMAQKNDDLFAYNRSQTNVVDIFRRGRMASPLN
jgi:hypothetical protein